MTPPTVFISYSRQDETEKNALLTHLEALQQAGRLTVWSDDDIAPGADRPESIAQAIAGADVALLLVTANYLASEFITGREVPALLSRQAKAGLRIFPLIARHCAWSGVEWLARLQIRPKDRQPVWRQGSDPDRELAAIAAELIGLKMPDQEPEDAETGRNMSVGGVKLAGISGSEIKTGDIIAPTTIAGDVVGRDKYDIHIHPDKPRPKAPDPETLAAAEQSYRERIKARYGEDAPYFIPLAGETTEVTANKTKPKALQLALRHRQKVRGDYHEWEQAGQEIKRVKLDTLRAGVDKYPCVILLGDPGSGKTMALENLAYEFAIKTSPPLALSKVEGGIEGGLLPLPLRLSEFGPGMTVEAFIEQGWAGSEQSGYWGMAELAANLAGYLEAGRLFVLFDALNEMPQEEYAKRAQALRSFIDRWSVKGNRFLVTCRVLDYGEELSGLQRVEVQPFNNDQIKAFIQNVLPQSGAGLWQTLGREKEARRRLLELARNPYLLTMMVVIFDEVGHLSQNRAELMTDFTQMLMGWAKEKCDRQKWLDTEVQVEALSVLAYETQARAGFGTMIKTGLVKAVMPELVQPDPAWPPVPAPPEQVLTLAAGANIIEMPGDRSTMRFYHQLLQEYFAARELLKRLSPSNFLQRGADSFSSPLSGRTEGGLKHLWQWPWLEAEMPLWERPENNWDPLPPPPPTGWEETTIVAAGLAVENDDQLAQTLTQINPVLAGRCLHEGQAKVTRATRQGVIAALLTTIAQPEVALRVRIAAGEVLGYLGDPRLGELVTVPAGEFWMGTDRQALEKTGLKWQSWMETESPQHKLYLPDYRIGKYPVTNAEYGHFIEAGGYREKRWWTETGRQQKENETWTEPRYWRDARFNKPNQPVVGVSWYETVAYCRWLSAKSGRQYRLPSEAEWEKAARGPSTGSGQGTDGRIYPWGDQFEAGRLNVREGEQQVRTTTPVGIYADGVSPFGVFDCAGNVFEWSSTVWEEEAYPFKVQQEWTEEHLSRTNVLRVLRGGSWSLTQLSARCACRDFRFDPTHGNLEVGFRVVVSFISHPSGL